MRNRLGRFNTFKSALSNISCLSDVLEKREIVKQNEFSVLLPFFVVFMYGSGWQCVCVNHTRDFGKSVLGVFHRVFIVVCPIPYAVVPFAKDISNVIHFDAWVWRFFRKFFQGVQCCCCFCSINSQKSPIERQIIPSLFLSSFSQKS